MRITLLVAVMCVPQTSVAMRLVSATVYLNGKPVLFASTGDNGRANRDTVWEYLDQLKWRNHKNLSDRNSENLYDLPDTDALKISGKLFVRINFGGSVSLTGVKLRRHFDQKRSKYYWKLEPGFAKKFKAVRQPSSRERLNDYLHQIKKPPSVVTKPQDSPMLKPK